MNELRRSQNQLRKEARASRVAYNRMNAAARAAANDPIPMDIEILDHDEF